MTATELKNHPVVRRLTSIQEALGLKNIPFADTLRLGIHGANWGKILAGNYTGSFSNALIKLEVALDAYEHPGTGDVEEGVVLLSHVRESLDAFEIASKADDEHQLVILAGQRGAGKTKTISLVHHRYGGSSLEALPSWAGSYYDFLKQFADGLGVTATGCHSKGAFEMAILSDLAASPRPIFTDEFNYFSPAGINFVKAILNRTRCPVMLASVPHFLSRMAADTRTAQESSQLIRRAVAVIHIPAVTEREVVQLQTTLFPNLELSADAARAIATSANRLGRLDSVYAILEDAESPADIQKAIGRHQRSKKTTLLPKEE